ncbi:MAG: glycosyltransferase [Clostridia bacterium]|nr:glycosyltransferase [Clostridia bacterium]
MTREYSVLMSVYRNTQKDEFIQCVDSMLAQNPKPKEFIVVIDGNINSELRALIEDYVKKQIIIPVPLQQNVGLGNALRVGCEYCSCEWIARMNSDDIAAPDRIEKQFEYIDSHPDVDVLGGNIAEFNGNPDNAVSVRRVPQSHEDICSFMRERCPFNHMTVMIRKEAMNDAGGYKDWQFNEDGYL